jgi:hypothetical protein
MRRLKYLAATLALPACALVWPATAGAGGPGGRADQPGPPGGVAWGAGAQLLVTLG